MAPGVFESTYSFDTSRPRPAASETLPPVPNVGIGRPVPADSAYRRWPAATSTRRSSPSSQYVTPRFTPSELWRAPAANGSNCHFFRPVEASSANTFNLGEVA